MHTHHHQKFLSPNIAKSDCKSHRLVRRVFRAVNYRFTRCRRHMSATRPTCQCEQLNTSATHVGACWGGGSAGPPDTHTHTHAHTHSLTHISCSPFLLLSPPLTVVTLKQYLSNPLNVATAVATAPSNRICAAFNCQTQAT